MSLNTYRGDKSLSLKGVKWAQPPTLTDYLTDVFQVSAAHRQAGEELLTGFYGKLSKEGKSSAVQELRALSTENLLVKTKNFEETMVHVRSIADSIAKSNAEVTSSRSYQRLGKLVREALELIESLKTLVLEHEEQYR